MCTQQTNATANQTACGSELHNSITLETQPTPEATRELSELWTAMRSEPNRWIRTTKEMHDEMLNVLPPRAGGYGCFLVGEADHHNGDGDAVFSCFRKIGGSYEARYMTARDFYAKAGF